MLHLTDGESVAGTLRQSGVPGEVRICGDLLYEGPAPAGLSAGAWRETRAGFIADCGWAGLPDALRYIESCDDSLAAFTRHEETVIWMDQRLSDQLILVRALDWFSRQQPGSRKLTYIPVERISSNERFLGLGSLPADRLAAIFETRIPVTTAQLDLAQRAWRAFTSPDPTAIETVIHGDTAALPFLAGALHRHLQEFPATIDGLSRTERQALDVLRVRGPLPVRQLFAATQQAEEHRFLGDASFFRILRDLGRELHPLIGLSAAAHPEKSDVSLTDDGRRVIAGADDRIRLNGIDTWLGGVQLIGFEPAWRWDRATGRLVTQH